MKALLLCKCQGMDPFCSSCNGHEKIEVTQTYYIPPQLDFDSFKFEPIAGLFQVFQTNKEIIGVGNIDYRPDCRSYLVYDLHSFFGEEGYNIMIETMITDDDIDFIEGMIEWKDCLR